MLHVGHFSFDALSENSEQEHGYFTCIIDIESPKMAVEAFTRHILELKKTDFAFSHIERVYLEDVIQVAAVSRQPFVTSLQSSKGPFPKSISYTLPSADLEGVEAYGLSADVDSQDTLLISDSYMESKPLIDFFSRRSS